MQESSLSCSQVEKWLSKLPEDFREAAKSTVDPALDARAAGLERDVMAALAKGEDAVMDVLDAHDSTLAELERPQRLRLLTKLFSDPKSLRIAKLISERIKEHEATDGDGTGQGGTKRRYPPILLSDIEAFAKVVTSRVVRAASATTTVDAIAAGIKATHDLEDARGPGGMA